MKSALAALVCLAALAVPSSAAAAKELRVRYGWKPGAFFDEAVQKFAARVEKETKGALKVTILPAPERAEVEATLAALKAGDHEMSMFHAHELAGLNPAMRVFELPFQFSDEAEVSAFITGPRGEKLLAGLAPAGLRGLDWAYSGGFSVFWSSGRPLSKPADLAGAATFARNGGEASAKVLQAFGAVPVADGAPIELIEAHLNDPWMKAPPRGFVAKEVWETNHRFVLTAVVLNEKFHQGLTEEQQKIVREAMREAAAFERSSHVTLWPKIRDGLRASGVAVHALSPEDRAALKAKAEPVIKAYAESVGAKAGSKPAR